MLVYVIVAATRNIKGDLAVHFNSEKLALHLLIGYVNIHSFKYEGNTKYYLKMSCGVRSSPERQTCGIRSVHAISSLYTLQACNYL